MTITYDPHDPPLMECGHTANACDGEGLPVCVICFGIVDGAKTVVERPSLDGRTMICSYRHGRGGKVHEPTPSKWGAAFFEYRPDDEHDRFYCGCWGWD